MEITVQPADSIVVGTNLVPAPSVKITGLSSLLNLWVNVALVDSDEQLIGVEKLEGNHRH
jgi:hypothetical protein